MLYLREVDYNAYAYILNYYGLKDFGETYPKTLPHNLRKMNFHHK